MLLTFTTMLAGTARLSDSRVAPSPMTTWRACGISCKYIHAGSKSDGIVLANYFQSSKVCITGKGDLRDYERGEKICRLRNTMRCQIINDHKSLMTLISTLGLHRYSGLLIQSATQAPHLK